MLTWSCFSRYGLGWSRTFSGSHLELQVTNKRPLTALQELNVVPLLTRGSFILHRVGDEEEHTVYSGDTNQQRG